MGGPRSPAEVRPFLEAIFRDPAILPLGWLRGAAARLIAWLRAPRVRARYRRIGGGSPLPSVTALQASAVAEELRARGSRAAVGWGLRYGEPSLAHALDDLRGRGATEVAFVPLYPHASDAVTGSAVREIERAAARIGAHVRVVDAWADRDDLMALWRGRVADAFRRLGPGARVLFVAHGIPMRSVRRGEDYPARVARTAAELAVALPAGTAWSVAYQSRVGPVRWTGPYLEDELERLAASPAPLLLVPLSFVSDCLETLWDLDVVAIERARALGITEVVRMPVFNDDPAFAAVLARAALARLAEAG
jgi:ferrochelatase